MAQDSGALQWQIAALESQGNLFTCLTRQEICWESGPIRATATARWTVRVRCHSCGR
jgi:hypothetical protein